MSKTKIVIIFFIVGFSLALIKPISQRINFANSNVPSDKTEIKFEGDSAQINRTFEFKLKGCHEVGLYSKTDTFRGFLMESPELRGDYTLTYSINGIVIKTKNATINKDAKTTGFTGVGGKTRHSTLMLDVIEVKYKEIDINLELKNLDRIILNDDIYLYVRLSGRPCGKRKELLDSKEISTPETNETLIPLYNALQNNNITDLKNFFQATKLPHNVTMLGNRTALHYAVYFNNANATAYLLSKDRTMLDKRDIVGRTALSYGIEYVYVDAVKELLRYKPDFEIVELQKRFPYEKAEYYGSKGIMEFLFYAKRTNLDDISPQYRVFRKQIQLDVEGMLEALLEGGLDPNIIQDPEKAAEYMADPQLDKKYYWSRCHCIADGTYLDYALIEQVKREDYVEKIKYYEENNITDKDRPKQDHTKIIQSFRNHGGKTFAELNNQTNITIKGE
jgi:hypothetical protein